ncbi:hypothetical protein GALMADRAFT_137421 [Galerina marginata CBS 339.88]|uniref:Uncharacterized protein n=1 Tax=Galerina marginata (strain CBS 339.88) TaxID=685588 RepID=A0A067TI88_GALM3|nr:hypothetical protein GALMADRAFT_137421 [Galerina marginata CBS 339.88]
MKANKPVIIPTPCTSSIPPDDAPAQSTAPPVTEISHAPSNKPPYDAEIMPDCEREPAPGKQEHDATAEDRDEAQTAGLEGKKTSDCAIAANFVDADILTVGLRETRVLEPGDADYARRPAGWQRQENPTKAAPLDDPGEGDEGLLAEGYNLQGKQDAVEEIERRAAQLEAKGARAHGNDSFDRSTSQASI